MFIRGLRSLIWLPLRLSRVTYWQFVRAVISQMPMSLRSRSCTSEAKVTPPKLISCCSCWACSLWMAQLGRALESSESWLSVMSMPLMLRLLRFDMP